MDELPYALMCELRKLSGDQPSMSFRPIGNKRPSPEAMQMRTAYLRPLSPERFTAEMPDRPESKYEYSASLQDLIDFGLLKHGFWHDGDRQTTQYGFHLTEKAMTYLNPSPPHPPRRCIKAQPSLAKIGE